MFLHEINLISPKIVLDHVCMYISIYVHFNKFNLLLLLNNLFHFIVGTESTSSSILEWS